MGTQPLSDIRWMIRCDMLEVLNIEHGSLSVPWHEGDFMQCLRQRNCIGMVAEFERKILGFMVYELHKSSLEILNYAVHPDYRRRGVGRKLFEKLRAKLRHQRRTELVLAVRESNLPAQLFFQSCGFVATGVLRKHYEDCGGEAPEDAYRMIFRKEWEEADEVRLHG